MIFSLLQTLHQIPIAVVDVETTGASPDFGHRVIEVGIVRLEGGRPAAEYQQLINPGRRIGAGISALTGITDSMVTEAPDFAGQLPRMLEMMRGAIVLGHNVRFDLGFLSRELCRCGCEICQTLGDAPVMDTLRIARRRFGRGGNSLQTLARRLGMAPPVAHRALADAQTTAFVFEQLLAPLGGWSLSLVDALSHHGGAMGLLPANPRESILPLELSEALDFKLPVMMEYVDATQRVTRRVVRPLSLRRMRGELMLVAHCELRSEQRTFKLDRIVQLSRVGDEPAMTATHLSMAAESSAAQPPTP